MAVNDNIKQDLNRLVNRGLSTFTKKLPERSQGVSFGVKRASGVGATQPPVTEGPSTVTKVRKEVQTVYSILLITEDGAFEKPPGWPGTGEYPYTGAPNPDPLPPSLTFSGNTNTLTLDPTTQYYEQRRVHSIKFEEVVTTVKDGVTSEEKTLVEEQYFVDMAMPYLDTGFYQGTENHSQFWAPALVTLTSPVATLL